jgi:hypothetical protein
MSQNTLTGEKLSPDRPITYSGVNWCPVFEREVDHHLVKILAPSCIKEHNGCANCPKVEYKDTLTECA